MTIHIQLDNLYSQASQDLVTEHLAGMHGNSPPGHVNALAIDGLRAVSITFWTAWQDGQLCGCAALKALSDTAGEVRSMRTRQAYLRQGVAQALLMHLIQVAQSRAYTHLYLETGTGKAFDAAHALYLRNGFEWCGAFGGYKATEFNVFMVRQL